MGSSPFSFSIRYKYYKIISVIEVVINIVMSITVYSWREKRSRTCDFQNGRSKSYILQRWESKGKALALRVDYLFCIS